MKGVCLVSKNLNIERTISTTENILCYFKVDPQKFLDPNNPVDEVNADVSKLPIHSLFLSTAFRIDDNMERLSALAVRFLDVIFSTLPAVPL